MSQTLMGRVTRMQGEMAKVESTEGVATHNALAYPETRVSDYVLAQARLILGIISEEEAQQLLAAEHQLQHLFETLAKEDEDS
jgi:hydrogenase maturation factor